MSLLGKGEHGGAANRAFNFGLSITSLTNAYMLYRLLDIGKTNLRQGINQNVKPSGTGCVECLATDGWWLHLRRCTECGHIGCCDNSPNQHASKHNATTGHPIITSFEHGEDWFYDYRTGEFFAGPKLVGPHAHPLNQPVPGPQGRIPSDWQSQLHE